MKGFIRNLFGKDDTRCLLTKRRTRSEDEDTEMSSEQDSIEENTNGVAHQIEEVNNDNTTLPSEESVLAESNSNLTIPELFVKVLPDVRLEVPNVLILGEQSSGKTSVILSLIFYYLIDHPLLTDEMGMSILNFFRTGNSMVTRRPTTVRLIHSMDEKVHFSLMYKRQTYEFGTPEYQEITQELSSVPPGELFKEEIILQIITNNIPDLVFTDYPGITSKKNQTFSDCTPNDPISTLEQLVKQKIRQPFNTLVIVEPVATEDYSTSHIIPLVKECASTRPEVWENSVLVLTKCDKKSENAFRADNLPVLTANNKRRGNDKDNHNGQTTSSSRDDKIHNFRHVIAVINRFIEGDGSSAVSMTEYNAMETFQHFKTSFIKTREMEKNYFQNNFQLSNEESVTAKALVGVMDKIFFRNLERSMKKGMKNIHKAINCGNWT
jgi:hypothetical protein